MNNSFRHRRKKSAGLRPSDLPPIGSEKIVQTDLLGQFRENISGFKGGVAQIHGPPAQGFDHQGDRECGVLQETDHVPANTQADIGFMVSKTGPAKVGWIRI